MPKTKFRVHFGIKTRIAIIGAGFAGLAAAWHLSAIPQAHVTLFDPAPMGSNASGLSAGLLHPFLGSRANMATNGAAGMAASLELLKEASRALGRSVFRKSGLLRPALTEVQLESFQACALKHEGVRWLESWECQQIAPGMIAKPGIFIESAYQIEPISYLEGLKKACEYRGVAWESKKIGSLKELENYDAVIVATGAFLLPELADLPIHPVKGQVLLLDWDHPLSVPVNAVVYLVRSGKHVIAGATFEHHFSTPEPDLERAKADLYPKLVQLFPSIVEARIIGCKAGVRASTPSRSPLVQQVLPKTWVIQGMGSKGLLYHALCAEELAYSVAASI